MAGLDAQLQQLRSDLAACSGDPAIQAQSYHPDAAAIAGVQEAVRLKKEEIEAACRDSALGKTVATMEANLAEVWISCDRRLVACCDLIVCYDLSSCALESPVGTRACWRSGLRSLIGCLESYRR